MKNIILLITALSLISCSSGDQGAATNAEQKTSATTPIYDNTLAKGKITDSVICKYQGNQSYALYLPSYYTPEKQFPCIYLFDAHARGVMPVKLYKDLAEKYGFVLIGSNVSKNGMQWPVTNEVVKTLMDDTRARINIDPKRIYTGGFSGGSRVASSVAILDGGVAGVIGCAAGFPRVEQGLQNKFDYFGMAGDYDFNLGEMKELDKALEQNGFAHQLLTFEGKHDWPAPADFETALLWIQVNAIKENLQSKNDQLIAEFKADLEKQIAGAKASGDVIKEHDLLEGMVRTLSGIADASSFKKQSDDLGETSNYKNAITLQTKLQQQEAEQQQELQRDFTAHNEQWWSGKIATLNKSIHGAKTKQESQMNQRVLNYLGLVSYLNANHTLTTGDLENAVNYIHIFKMADPQNPDHSYLLAVYYMKKGDHQQAITSLNDAAVLGYSEAATLLTDPSFSSLQGDAGFNKVMGRIRDNAVK